MAKKKENEVVEKIEAEVTEKRLNQEQRQKLKLRLKLKM